MRIIAYLAALGALLVIPCLAAPSTTVANPLLPPAGKTLNYQMQIWRLDHNPVWDTKAPTTWHLLTDAEMKYLGTPGAMSVSSATSAPYMYPLDTDAVSAYWMVNGGSVMAATQTVTVASLIPPQAYNTLPSNIRTILQHVNVPSNLSGIVSTMGTSYANAGSANLGSNYQTINQTGSGASDRTVQIHGDGNVVTAYQQTGVMSGTAYHAERLYFAAQVQTATVAPAPTPVSVRSAPCLVYLQGKSYVGKQVTRVQRDPSNPALMLTEEDIFIGTVLYKRTQTVAYPATPQSQPVSTIKRVATLTAIAGN